MASWHPSADVVLTDSEDEEDEYSYDYSKGREVILFVIDACMLKTKHLDEALDIVRKAFISALLVNDKDLIGVMFANTEHSPAPIETNCLDNIAVPSNCAVLLPLRQLSKAIVEYFLQFVKSAPNTFAKNYGHEIGNFASMIRLCCSLFQHCGYQCNNATIVYLTDTESPHEVDTPNYRRALLKAKDLGEQDVVFHVIPMVDDFDYDVFYKEFLTLVRDVELDSFERPDPRRLREILSDRKLKQDLSKRTLGNFEFTLGPGLDMSVQYFNYFKRRCYPRKVVMMRKDNSIVQKKRVFVVRQENSETQEFESAYEVDSKSGWYKIKIGNELTMRVNKEQIDRVRKLHEPGMLLLGFKPAATLSADFFCKPCHFMYPVDTLISGSKRLFRALWQRCYERKKIAICLFVCKRKAPPRYVALVPVSASSSEMTNQEFLLSGDGFKIVYLPFGKTIRRIDFTNWNSMENEAPAEGVACFEKIIRKTRLRYQRDLISDPALEMLQAQLLALALDIPTENEGRTIMPDVDTQDARIQHLLPEFMEIFGEEEAVAKKRSATSRGNSSETKIVKVTDNNLESYDFVEQLIANDTLSSCTVAQLRSILDNHFGAKMAASTKKQLLIERIKELSV